MVVHEYLSSLAICLKHFTAYPAFVLPIYRTGFSFSDHVCTSTSCSLSARLSTSRRRGANDTDRALLWCSLVSPWEPGSVPEWIIITFWQESFSTFWYLVVSACVIGAASPSGRCHIGRYVTSKENSTRVHELNTFIVKEILAKPQVDRNEF